MFSPGHQAFIITVICKINRFSTEPAGSELISDDFKLCYGKSNLWVASQKSCSESFTIRMLQKMEVMGYLKLSSHH